MSGVLREAGATGAAGVGTRRHSQANHAVQLGKILAAGLGLPGAACTLLPAPGGHPWRALLHPAQLCTHSGPGSAPASLSCLKTRPQDRPLGYLGQLEGH